MGRLGFYFDARLCIACKTCQVACKDKNDLPAGSFFRKVSGCEIQEDGQPRQVHYSGACNHCAKPACVDACPTGAMLVMADGTVGNDKGKCIGCGACVWSCPYGAPHLNRQGGISQKCDSCADLREKGKSPACVDACLTHCLEFGDLDELREKYGPELARGLPGMPDAGLTDPSLLIEIRG